MINTAKRWPVFMRGDGIFWFRLYQNGPGLHFKDTRKHRLLFSERNGFRKGLRIGPYWIAMTRRIVFEQDSKLP